MMIPDNVTIIYKYKIFTTSNVATNETIVNNINEFEPRLPGGK